MIRRFVFGLILVLLTGCGSESFTEIEKVRAPLIAGFESYASREEVLQKLSRKSEVKVVDDTSLAKNSSVPPYKLYTISVSPHEHAKHRGKLLLTFFNNRLERSVFYPEKLESYIEVLDQLGLRVGLGQELSRGDTVIWEGTDADHLQYVGWADKRLRDQQRRWLARYN